MKKRKRLRPTTTHVRVTWKAYWALMAESRRTGLPMVEVADRKLLGSRST